MKQLRMNYLVLFILLGGAVRVSAFDLGFAQDNNGQPGAFLNFAGSARSLGMGRAFVGIADDASATYLNPAGLAQINRRDLVSLYSALHEGYAFGLFSYAQPTFGSGTSGLSVVTLRADGFQRRTSDGQTAGSFSDSQLAVLLGHGLNLGSRFSLGATGKFVRQDLDVYSGSGFGLDIGGLMRLVPETQIGVVVKNAVAPRLKLKEDEEKYPLDTRVGFLIKPRPGWIFTSDVSKIVHRSLKLHIGSEWQLTDLLFLRTGLNESELTAGFGFLWGDFHLDYAFGFQDAAPGVRDLGGSHRIGFHLRFGPTRKDLGTNQVWRARGQNTLDELRGHMNASKTLEPAKAYKLIVETTEAIHHNAFPFERDRWLAQGYMAYFQGRYQVSLRCLTNALHQHGANDEEIERHMDRIKSARENYQTGTDFLPNDSN